jgi:5-(carboxyamino)imidazole ribonucleotide synthase
MTGPDVCLPRCGKAATAVPLTKMDESSDPENQTPNAQSREHPRLGIIGGGQLAKLTALAAAQLGCEVVVLDSNRNSPAARVTSHSLVGDWNDVGDLLRLAQQVDVISIENEFLDVEALTCLERAGYKIFPRPDTLRLVQDKFRQKQTLAAAGLPLLRFAPVHERNSLLQLAHEFGWPLVLKKCRNGYDGKGNFTLRSEADIPAAWQALHGDQNELYAEEFCPFIKELALIITRGVDGRVARYPVVETVQRDHICHLVKVPAAVPIEVARSAAEIGQRAIEAIGGVGSFGVEMFLTARGEVLVNELAPRVHNSGHYTIEACACSQFENHVRALFGWPLGSTSLVSPAAAMVNLLGAAHGPGTALGLARALAVPGAHVHIYGKAMSSAGRKMGHITALGATANEAADTAVQAAREILFGKML